MPPPPVRRTRPRLGELLVHMGYLTADQVDGVSVHQRQWGLSFGRAAVARGLCTDEQVVAALARQVGMSTIDLERETQSPEVFRLLPLAAARTHRAVLLRIEGTTLKVAMAAPATFTTQDAIRALVGKSRLEVLLASDVAIDRAIARFYGLPMVETTRPAESARDSLVDPQAAVTSAQPIHQAAAPRLVVTPQVPQTGPIPPANPVSRVELFELLGLSPRASELVQHTARSHRLTNREVIARVLEQWALSVKDKPPQR